MWHFRPNISLYWVISSELKNSPISYSAYCCDCNRKISAGSLFLCIWQKRKSYQVKLTWHYVLPKAIDIGRRGVNRITYWSQGVASLLPKCHSPSPPLENIRVMIVWRLRRNIIRTAPCWVVWHNVHGGGAAAGAPWAMAPPKFWLGVHNAFGPSNDWHVHSLVLAL